MLRMRVYMHSRFIENHPIWILEDGHIISKVVLSQPVAATTQSRDVDGGPPRVCCQ
jgi:hypothetical protein